MLLSGSLLSCSLLCTEYTATPSNSTSKFRFSSHVKYTFDALIRTKADFIWRGQGVKRGVVVPETLRRPLKALGVIFPLRLGILGYAQAMGFAALPNEVGSSAHKISGRPRGGFFKGISSSPLPSSFLPTGTCPCTQTATSVALCPSYFVDKIKVSIFERWNSPQSSPVDVMKSMADRIGNDVLCCISRGRSSIPGSRGELPYRCIEMSALEFGLNQIDTELFRWDARDLV
jgi:hypothetical protein